MSDLGNAIFTALAMTNVCFTAMHLLRIYTVRGSRSRYVAATVQWALIVPALAFRPSRVILTGGPLTWLDLLWLLDLIWVYMLLSSDDDNWWRRTRKRLGKWVRQSLHAPRLQPAGVSA